MKRVSAKKRKPEGQQDAEETYAVATKQDPGTGPASAGQSGDTQGLSTDEEANSESVRELVEEGQYLEAQVVSGVENAPDADVSEVHTREVPEDDVPDEYLGREEAENR